MRILIVDDHEVVRRGVRAVLSAFHGFEICGEAVDGRDAIEKARKLRPDVVTMDISMPEVNGLEATREIRRILPDTKIVILSQHDVPEMITQAHRAGAHAYIVKSAISTNLIAALEKMHDREVSFDASAVLSGPPNVDVNEVLQRSAAFEKALRDSEERFRLTFEQAAVGMAHVGEDGRWLRVNKKVCEIVGYSEPELRHLTVQQITHPEDLAAELVLAERVARGEIDQYSIEKRFVRKDGRTIWSNLTVAVVRDSERRLKYLVAVVEDITIRKQAERAQGQLAAIVESSDDAIISKDLNGIITSWNTSAEHIFGFTAEEAIGQPITIIIPRELHGEELQILARLRAGERIDHYETVRQTKSGDRRHISLTISPLRDAHGKIIGASKIARDITHSKHDDQAQHHLAAIVESSDDAIVSKDLNGVIRSWNAGAQRIFGFTPEEAVGRPITIIIPRELHDEERQILARLRRGERIDHYETVRQTKSGARRHISLTISPLRDAHGKIIGASKIARDITERKRAEQVLREAELSGLLLHLQDEERRRIARELHDSAGQILAAARINLDLAAMERAKLSPSAAAALEQNVSLLDQLTSEIRTMSHLLHPPLLDELGLKLALEEYIRGFSQRSGIQVTLDLPDDIQRFPQDCELSLFRIVQECLTNIYRHSGSPQACIRLSRSSDEITLEVCDQGRGLSSQLQEKLLTGQSSGVGLRGMRERVRQLGGALEVDSEEGSGTCIRVILPLSRHDPLGDLQLARPGLASSADG